LRKKSKSPPRSAYEASSSLRAFSRKIAKIIPDIFRCAPLSQKICHIRVALHHRDVQRSATHVADLINVDARADQQLDSPPVPTASGYTQQAVAGRINVREGIDRGVWAVRPPIPQVVVPLPYLFYFGLIQAFGHQHRVSAK
jgi:hypothetical protein